MENNKINYKKGLKHYDAQKSPKKQLWIFKELINLISRITIGKKTKIEKINMQGLKAPYVVLSNHMAFADLEINAMANYPNRISNIATFETFHKRALLLELCGCIGKRKFTTDPNLISACETVLNKFKSVLTIYPEARYSPIGTTAIIPPSYAQLLKRLRVPVCALVHHGNYLSSPFWDWRRTRRVQHYSTLKLILTKEDLENKSPEEIYDIIVRELSYNEYKYQKDNNIIIDEPYRAEGLHKVLYQCPNCNTEHKMSSSGATLKCEHCGKVWEMTTLGEINALDGNTEFAHIPDWFEWQRANVRNEIDNDNYNFEDEVDLYSLPNAKGFISLGRAKLTHNGKVGFKIEGSYNGKDFKISRPCAGMYGVHIEYDYCYIRPDECIQISTLNDTFVCYPTKRNVVTKLSFATEELYKKVQEERKRRKDEKAIAKALN